MSVALTDPGGLIVTNLVVAQTPGTMLGSSWGSKLQKQKNLFEIQMWIFRPCFQTKNVVSKSIFFLRGKTIDTTKPFLISHYQDGGQANIWMEQVISVSLCTFATFFKPCDSRREVKFPLTSAAGTQTTPPPWMSTGRRAWCSSLLSGVRVAWKGNLLHFQTCVSFTGDSDTNNMGWLDDKTGCTPENGVVGCDINNAQVCKDINK